MNTGLTFIPKFVKQTSAYSYGSKVTHEDYNEKINLNTTQGDYNTTVLLALLTNPDVDHTYHIPYIDNAITDLENTLESQHDDIVNLQEDVTNIHTSIDNIDSTIDRIEDGTFVVGKAHVAESLIPTVAPGPNQYYGTDANSDLGFKDLPDFLYAVDMESSTGVDGVYYTPALNSVAEPMLSAEVRYKLNRETNTDYDYLDNKPSIGGVTLSGAMSLSDLGIQAAGSYVTTTALATTLLDYATIADTQAWVNDQLTGYATTTTTNNLSLALDATTLTANNAYDRAFACARVYINNYPANPQTGDIWVQIY